MPFSLSLASTSSGATHTPEFLRINPKGRIPVLVVGGSTFTEAPAILLHLATTYPEQGLLPAGNNGLIRAVEWMNWLSGYVHATAVRQVWRPEVFTNTPAHHKGIETQGKTNLMQAFAHIEGRLQGTKWALGDQFSIVDAYLLVFFRWGNRMGMDMRGLHPRWTQHTLQTLDRPAAVRALETEGISVWQ